ncbi:hypothetical protein ACE6H2_000282 [Prunus campanulata]
MVVETECSTDGTSIIVGEDHLIEALKESMRRKLGPAVSPLPSTCCIFKVPQVLRRHNTKAYQPDVVSIGPYHRHSEELQRMETVKQWYFRNLLTRMKISAQEFIQRINDETENGIIEFEKRARSFYAEPLDHLKEKELMEIMILDGCFVVQLLQNFKDHKDEKDDDPILNMDCMFQYVCHDLLLLENQLPWFVLICLYRLTLGSDSGNAPKFSELLLNAFGTLASLFLSCKFYLKYLNHHEVDDNEVLHILDLTRTSIVFTPEEEDTGSDNRPPTSTNLQNYKKFLCCFAEKEEEEIISEIPTATALSEAGVRFEKTSEKNPNIEFKNGVFKIPELAVGELTEPLLRNLIAFEQCYHGRSHQITSYAVIMDNLISSDKDIKLLSENKILSNWLNVEDVSKFFNSLYIDTTVDFQYERLFGEVNKYYRVKWNKHLEQLRSDYFSSPWKIIALTVGILILLVTLMQFILSVLSSTLFTGIRVHELSADM